MMGVEIDPMFGFDGVESVEVLENRDAFVAVNAGSGGLGPLIVFFITLSTSERNPLAPWLESTREVISNALAGFMEAAMR